MYVDNVSQVKVRKAPNTSSDEVLALSKGDSVTILKTGVVDGKEWKYVVVKVDPKKPGDGVTYERGYISADCLSYTNGDMSLEDLLKLYPMFTATEATTMYVLLDSSITIRSNPVFPEEGEDNSLSNPGSTEGSIKSLKVLANGEIDGIKWFLVESTKKEGETEKVIRGFVGGKALEFLTSDPSGKKTVTIEELLLKYPEFEKLETPVTVKTVSEANCYGTPETTKDPIKKIAADTQVILVAKEEGNFVTWAVIQDSQGALYFVHFDRLTQAQ